MKSNKYVPGMRNIKTAIAIFIDLLIFRLLNFNNCFYACIASVVCMQQSVEETVKAGKSRLIGTSMAAIIGLIVYYIGENFFSSTAYLIFIPIGAIILIQICVLLKCSSSASIACIVYISILTSHRIAGDNPTYPVTRIIETFVGILVATIVNNFLSRKYLDKIKSIIDSYKNR